MNDGVKVGPETWDVWQSIPDSPLEVMIQPQDHAGSFHLRWNGEVAQEWFQKMVDINIHSIGWELRENGWIV